MRFGNTMRGRAFLGVDKGVAGVSGCGSRDVLHVGMNRFGR